MTSVGQFNQHLLELEGAAGANLQIIDGPETLALIRRLAGTVRPFMLESMETYYFVDKELCVRPAALDKELLRAIGEFGVSIFCDDIRTQEVLLIDRAETTNGHGADTRRIVNIKEIASQIGVQPVALEGMSMRDQISMFRGARTIIAQHGSALGHIIWCRPGTRVIELVPKTFDKWGWQYFELLSSALGLRKTKIVQIGPFEPVDITQLKHALISK